MEGRVGDVDRPVTKDIVPLLPPFVLDKQVDLRQIEHIVVCIQNEVEEIERILRSRFQVQLESRRNAFNDFWALLLKIHVLNEHVLMNLSFVAQEQFLNPITSNDSYNWNGKVVENRRLSE